MDASALLLRQGWRGTGHSLDTSNRGIAKPLLVAHKQDQLGLGKRRVTHTTDDQWWMRAFDESLKNIGTGASEKSTLNQIRTKGINRGGLYGFFVKGESLKGTLGDEVQSTVILPKGDGEKKKEKKRRREDDADADAETASSKKKSKKQGKSPSSEESTASKKTKSTADPPSKTQTPLGPLTRDQTVTILTFMKRANKSAKRAAKAQEQNKGDSSSSKKDKAARKQAARLAFSTLQKDAVIAGVLDNSLPNPQKWSSRAEVDANWDVVWRSIECVLSSVPASDSSATATTTDSSTSTTTAVQTPTSEAERGTDLAVAAKLAKLSPQERSAYAARATAKGQSLEVYVKRRIEKKKGSK